MAHITRAFHGNDSTGSAWLTGALAGIAGGGAEVLWIALYGRLSGTDAALVASGITGALSPGLSASGLAVPFGLAIHMTIALVLGMAIAVLLDLFVPRLRGTAFEVAAVVGLLLAVWAINFFLVLPAVDPAFVGLVPYWASLTSKMLFGAAAAFVLRFRP